MLPLIEPKTITNPNGKQERTVFIPSFLDDNQILCTSDPGYEGRLMARDEKTSRALRWGDWDVFAGQIFSEFNPMVHKCPPFDIPLSWVRRRGIDWGYNDPFVCLFGATDPATKQVIIYKEIGESGITDPHQAEMIRQHTLHGEHFSFNFADPSMWNAQTQDEIVTSTAEIYGNNHVRLTKADNNQRNKIAKTHSILERQENGLPGLVIFETCHRLITTLPALVYDENNVETIADGQDDHWWDALAYLLTNWVDPKAIQREKPKQNPIMEQRHGRRRTSKY
jgi:hypothetical protein